MHRAILLFAASAIIALSSILASSAAFALSSARVLTIRTQPDDIKLQSVFVDGQRAKLLAREAGYAFVEIRSETGEFECEYILSVIAENGRFSRQQYDLCESVWQVEVNFKDTGAGASKKQISVVPSDPDVRIYSLAIDKKPVSFTAFMETNRVEFTLRRGPSGYKCAVELEALMSDGKPFKGQVDLCARDDEVVLDLTPKQDYFEILTVRSSANDRITVVRTDGDRVEILRWIDGGVRVKLPVSIQGFKCDVKLDVSFASGSKTSNNVNVCTSDFDVSVTPIPQYATDISLASPFSWKFVEPQTEYDLAHVQFKDSSGRVAFLAACAPGSRSADLFIPGFPTSSRLKGNINLETWAGNYHDTLGAQIARPPFGVNRGVPFYTASTKNGIWNGLISGSAYTIIADEDHRLRLSLKGSAGPVREFVSACNKRFNGPSVIGDVTGDTGLGWSFRSVSNNGYALSFGNRADDRLGIEARCKEGEGFAQVVLASAPRNMPASQQVQVFWDTIGSQGEGFATTRNIGGFDWGALPVAKIDITNNFWNSLAAGNIVHIAMDGQRMSTYSLKGSSKPVRQFVNACRTYTPEPIPQNPVTPDQTTPEEEVLNSIVDIFNGINNANNGVNISIEGGNTAAKKALADYRNNPSFLCSETNVPTPTGQRLVSSGFVNRGNSTLELFEIRPNGQRVRLRAFPPGARLSVNAPTGQSWEVRTQNGSCVATYSTPNKDVEFSVNANMNQADPQAFAKTYKCGSKIVPVVIAPTHGISIIGSRYALHRAKVGNAVQNVWGSIRATINDQKLTVRGGNVPELNCVVR